MKDISLVLDLKTLPPVILRGEHALILVKDIEDHFILGCKRIYPQGICRLIGGGIEAGENPQLGAARELKEELHISVTSTDLQPLAKVSIHIHHSQQTTRFVTYLYFHQLKSSNMEYDSDLDGIVHLTEKELEGLIQRFQQLSSTIDFRVNS